MEHALKEKEWRQVVEPTGLSVSEKTRKTVD
jgi:hypothetical protein